MKIVVNLTSVPFVLEQIEYKKYAATLEARGIPEEKIHKYAFAFCGKHVLIGKSTTGDK